jgi:hypothetical protein
VLYAWISRSNRQLESGVTINRTSFGGPPMTNAFAIVLFISSTRVSRHCCRQ